MEVDEKPNRDRRQFQVRKQLSIMNWKELFDSFELHDYEILNDCVHSVGTV